MAEQKKSGVLPQIIVGVVLALLVGGSSPWWWKQLFGSNDTTPDANNGRVVSSREFMLGRWQVEQAAGQMSAGTVIDYQANGRFSGWATQFVGGSGRKMPLTGQWFFDKLSKDTFRLKILSDDQSTQEATFRIVDQDRVHNIDQNYDAVRVK